jgi:hypothetical protein
VIIEDDAVFFPVPAWSDQIASSVHLPGFVLNRMQAALPWIGYDWMTERVLAQGRVRMLPEGREARRWA